MKIFISFASEDRESAERIYHALQGANHDVFLSDEELPPGANYNSVISDRIRTCDCYIFLITTNSVTTGRYIHSELAQVKDMWRRPAGRVIPVMLEAVPMAKVPAYLANVTILTPAGNAAADVVTAVQQLVRMRNRKFIRIAILVLVALACVAFAVATLKSGFHFSIKPEFTDDQINKSLVHEALGDVFANQSDWEMAKEQYDKAHDITPGFRTIEEKRNRASENLKKERSNVP